MKYFYKILIFSLAIFNTCYSQTNLAQIQATATSSGNTATVNFVTQNNFVNSGESSNIKVFFQMPAAQTSGSTTVSINSSFPFVLTTNIASGGIRYMFFTATFASGFNLNTWNPSTSYEIGQFTFNNFTGPLNVTMYSANQSGASWNGTSMTKINGGNPDNLVSWPVNQNVVLPIDIKTFSATKDGDKNARLDWSTSLEINSAYFGVERSTDGNTWEAISKVAAAGNSNTEQLYTYTDRDLPLNRSKDQIFYYRLQLVDLDGQYKYSDIRGVNFGKVNTNKVISLYPNPAVQMVNLDLSGMDLESGAIHLRVTDMQGRNMIDKTILGNGIEPIEVTQLPAGTYNVAVSQGANLYQKQFIKIE